MGYLDSYQFSKRKFKFCFYILADNGLNVLLQIRIVLKVIVIYIYIRTL